MRVPNKKKRQVSPSNWNRFHKEKIVRLTREGPAAGWAWTKIITGHIPDDTRSAIVVRRKPVSVRSATGTPGTDKKTIIVHKILTFNDLFSVSPLFFSYSSIARLECCCVFFGFCFLKRENTAEMALNIFRHVWSSYCHRINPKKGFTHFFLSFLLWPLYLAHFFLPEMQLRML